MDLEYQVMELIDRMKEADSHLLVKTLSEIVSMGEPVLPILIEELKHRYSERKVDIITTLQKFGIRAVPYILDEIARLNRSASDEWLNLWHVLEDISYKEDLFYILKQLENHENAFSRATLAIFIEERKDMRGCDILIKFLNDEDEGVRRIAGSGLGKLRDPSALPTLYRMKEAATSGSSTDWPSFSIADNAIKQITGKQR